MARTSTPRHHGLPCALQPSPRKRGSDQYSSIRSWLARAAFAYPGILEHERASHGGMGGFAEVGAPIFGLLVGGGAVLELAVVVVEVTLELAVVGRELEVAVALVVSLSTERIEPVTTLTSAPPAGVPCPRTTAPESEDNTLSACSRWVRPS